MEGPDRADAADQEGLFEVQIRVRSHPDPSGFKENANSSAHSQAVQEWHYSIKPLISPKELERNVGLKTTHECSCLNELDCNGVHCSCYLTPHEMCFQGDCCSGCVSLKKQLLEGTVRQKLSEKRESTATCKAAQKIMSQMKQKKCTNMHYLKSINPHDPYLKHLTFCTCKKSHCQKKYCHCFEKNLKCGDFCFCLNCLNREPKESREEERMQELPAVRLKDNEEVDYFIEQFLQKDVLEATVLTEIMEFQAPDFDQVCKSPKQ